MSLTDNEKLKKRNQRKQERMSEMRKRYWQATAEDLPEVAAEHSWSISEPQAFQRIILDTICKGVWYDKIAEPAINNMSEAQLRKATYLAEDILHGRRMIEPLDEQSRKWREERKKRF